MSISKDKYENQICVNCVMDTSDSDISFDSEGVCNHCLKRKTLLEGLPNNDQDRQVEVKPMIV